MKSVDKIIKAHAALLDSQHKPDAPIHVRASRAYLRRFFKAAKRGGPLRVGGHELVLVADQPESAPEQMVIA